MLKKICKFFSKNYVLLIVLSLASFLRFFRLKELLGFWYDQGRDAQVIWDFIHNGKFFLIGPTTGIEGIFRGPWYYWLITPFYFLGKGNPVWPNVFLVLTSIFALFLLYKLGETLGGKKTGLLSIFIASVSYYLIGASRWLSNPTPMLIISLLLVWAIFKFLDKKVWAIPFIGFLIGMALNFGSAMEIWYIPALIIVLILKRKKLPNIKIISLSLATFLMAFLPQAFFELRHPGVLSGPFIKFLLEPKSVDISFWQVVGSKLIFYYNLFSSKFWINGSSLFAPFFVVFIFLLFKNFKKLWKDDKFKTIFIISIIPFIGGFLIAGDKGNLYEYYFTGYYLIWILLFSYVYMSFSKGILIKIIIGIFLILLILKNIIAYKSDYLVSLESPRTLAFSNQLSAIDWIYESSNGRDFNVDEYVPPVIPYAYRYLFTWLGTQKYHRLPMEQSIPLLYTLYESDLDHPERLTAWLERQKRIGEVLKEAKFGSITVQERQRISVR